MATIVEGTFIRVSSFFIVLNTVTVHLGRFQQTLIDWKIDPLKVIQSRVIIKYDPENSWSLSRPDYFYIMTKIQVIRQTTVKCLGFIFSFCTTKDIAKRKWKVASFLQNHLWPHFYLSKMKEKVNLTQISSIGSFLEILLSR